MNMCCVYVCVDMDMCMCIGVHVTCVCKGKNAYVYVLKGAPNTRDQQSPYPLQSWNRACNSA